MASSGQSAEVENLQKDMEALREDLTALTKLYKEKAKGEAEGIAARLKEGAEKATADANARVREGLSVASEQIEARPLTSMLVAFGIGLALGKLLDRR